MAHTVFIDGSEGTTGLQIAGRLAERPDIEVLRLPKTEYKSLPHRLRAAEAAEVSILCLPDAAAAELAGAAAPSVRLIDASTAHRTAPGWVYGFPELGGRRGALRAAARVAMPGCHASGFLALAAPLVEKGLLAPEAALTCFSLTGYSGGGKQMIAEYMEPERAAAYQAPRQYALGLAHKHLPEMRHIAGLAAPPLFSPVVADYYCGMLLSLPLPSALLAEKRRSPAALADFYREYYAGEALISVHSAPPAGGTLAANALAGRDDMELWVLGNDDQLLLAARYDNLGKGASGAAVQCLNLMLGREETAGLRLNTTTMGV